MMNEFEYLVNSYADWLKQRISLRQVDEYIEITTPFLDRHNDGIQFYAKREDGGFLLTDDSYIIDDLRQSGCELDTPKRRKLLEATLKGFGVQMVGDALQVHTTVQSFPQRKHNLVQAMLAVNDLFYLAVPTVASLFMEDVMEWMDSSEIRYVRSVKFTGKSGFDHHFDFVIPRSRQYPERIVQAVNRPTRDAAENFNYKWMDTKDARTEESLAYVILNDAEREPPAGVLDALRSYGVNAVLWSQRESVKESLAA